MSNGTNTTTDSSGVGSPIGLGFLLGDLFGGKKKKPFDPFAGGANRLKTREMIGTVERKIEEDIRLGNPVSDANLKRLAKLNKRLEIQERRHAQNLSEKGKARAFERAGIAALTLNQIADLIAGTSRGERIIGRHSSPIFNPPTLPTTTGGTSTMPFVVTPAASEPSSFGGFGNIVNSLIGAAGQIVPAVLGGRQQPPTSAGIPQFQQAGFPLVPAVGGALLPAITPALGRIGAGAIGGELADMLQNLFSSGGASSTNDAAAFTDAVPGACRPKAHMKTNPCTGKGTWFTPRGRPLLFSGDLSAAKRVDRVTKRVMKQMPTKRTACRKR